MALNVHRLRGPKNISKADNVSIGARGKNMNRKDMRLSGSKVRGICTVSGGLQ
jgi:hypothetical protein